MAQQTHRSRAWIGVLGALLVLPALALGRLGASIPYPWLLGGAGLMSAITWFTYVSDKRRAVANRRRVPELTLHALEMGGGWPAAFAGQQWLRHKNAKVSYQAVFWLIVALHQLVAVDYLLGWQITHALKGG
jgi:uncharacterized membrane protein YsdA (DUF1294 family)